MGGHVEPAEITDLLSRLPDVRCSVSGDQVRIFVPAIDDNVRLRAEEVRDLQPGGTRRKPGIGIIVGDNRNLRFIIVGSDDVAYAPASADSILESPVSFGVSDTPDLAAYSMMESSARRFADSLADNPPQNLVPVAGMLLFLRCCMVAATQFGMTPVRSVASWRQASAATDAGALLPPFKWDPAWNGLCAKAAVLSGEVDLAALTMTDFTDQAPGLAFTRLDEEFIESWRTWMTITPATFARLLLDRLDGTQAEVSLYPDGGGDILLTITDPAGSPVGVFLLGFSFPDDEFTVDEVRITGSARGKGIFKTLMWNAVNLSSVLGIRSVRTLATGDGSYKFAKMGFLPSSQAEWNRLRPLIRTRLDELHEQGLI
jgi:hypothetical protein